MKQFIETMWAEKEAHRRRRAQLPIEEKIRILVKMQERRAPILRARGIESRIWILDESEREDSSKEI